MNTNKKYKARSANLRYKKSRKGKCWANKNKNKSHDHCQPSCLVNSQQNSSVSEKLGLTQSSKVPKPADGYKIIDMKLFQQCISEFAVCTHCKSTKSKLQMHSNPSSQYGLAEKLVLKCSNCQVSSIFFTSDRVLTSVKKKSFDINVRSVHASQQGMGLAGLKKFCASMDLPPPVSSNVYIHRYNETPINKLCGYG